MITTYNEIRSAVESFDVDISIERRGESVFLKVENAKKPKAPQPDMGLESVF